MIPEIDLQQILNAGTQAPSGDNAQPWEFKVRDDALLLYNVPGKDTSLFNHAQTSNLIAIGAVLENISVKSLSLGYKASIVLFPDKKNDELVAEIAFAPTDKQAGTSEYIPKRCTNRKKYFAKTIPDNVITELESCGSYNNAYLKVVHAEQARSSLAQIVSLGEKIALENKNIHDFLYTHITWNKREDSVHHGFFIKTFELAPPQLLIFSLLQNWNILQFLNKFGIADFISSDTEQTYRTSAAFGSICIRGNDRVDIVEAGIVLERVWLLATKYGLSMQPLTAVPLLANYINTSKAALELDPSHIQLVRSRYKGLAEAFDVSKPDTIILTFRLGYSEEPSSHTTRHPATYELLTKS